MRRFLGTILLTLLLGLLAPAFSEAARHPDHQRLLDIVKEIEKARSDPATADTFVTEAASTANSLATDSCSSGYKENHVHGVLLAIRLLLRVGNVALHRHGNRDAANTALVKARDILVNTPLACMSGNESMAAAAAFQESINNITNVAAGVPAANPDLFPPPPGTPVSNHCAEEDPNLSEVYGAAQTYLNDGNLSGDQAAVNGGSVTCDPSDPVKVWRADVVIKEHGTVIGSQLVKVNIDTWACN